LKHCARESCRREFDPNLGRLGAPDYCSGTCQALASPAAIASAAARKARAETAAANRAAAGRQNIKNAQAAQAALRQARQMAGADGA
jgi:hypothetical protein